MPEQEPQFLPQEDKEAPQEQGVSLFPDFQKKRVKETEQELSILYGEPVFF